LARPKACLVPFFTLAQIRLKPSSKSEQQDAAPKEKVKCRNKNIPTL